MISVVITAYNRPDFLAQALSSVLAQTYRDFEVVIVDDCSPTDLAPTVARFEGPIRYHRLEKNGKLSNSRNQGVKLAKGEYVAFLDDDDAWLPNKLERQMATIGDRDVCLCGFQVMETGRQIVRDLDEVTEADLVYGNRYCGPTGMLARRELLIEEEFDRALGWGEDWDMYVRLARRQPLAYCRESLFERRTTDPASMTNVLKEMTDADAERVAGPLRKHRDWLGERLFRRRLAGAYLVRLGTRRSKAAAVGSAIRAAGLGPTLWFLTAKLSGREARLMRDPAWSPPRRSS